MVGRPGRRGLSILVALLSLHPGGVLAQGGDDEAPYPGGAWRLALGMAHQGVSDQLASPLRHRGTGPLVGFGYGNLGPGGGWELAADYLAVRVSSFLEGPDRGFEDTHGVRLGFAWVRRVGRLADGRLGLHLGGALDARFSIRSHHYGGGTESFGDLFAPFQAAAMWSLRLGPRALLTHRVSTPVASVVLRSPYTGLKVFPDVRVSGPWEARGFDSRLEARTGMGNDWGMSLFHEWSLLEYPDPLPLSWVVHRLGVLVELRR